MTVVADIERGRRAGLRTGWVSHGRTWPGGRSRRPWAGESLADVLDAVLRVSASG